MVSENQTPHIHGLTVRTTWHLFFDGTLGGLGHLSGHLHASVLSSAQMEWCCNSCWQSTLGSADGRLSTDIINVLDPTELLSKSELSI